MNFEPYEFQVDQYVSTSASLHGIITFNIFLLNKRRTITFRNIIPIAIQKRMLFIDLYTHFDIFPENQQETKRDYAKPSRRRQMIGK